MEGFICEGFNNVCLTGLIYASFNKNVLRKVLKAPAERGELLSFPCLLLVNCHHFSHACCRAVEKLTCLCRLIYSCALGISSQL